MATEELPTSAGLPQEELRQAQQQIQQLQQQLDGLLYSLSHDLRTPAMTILGFADLLTADLPQSTQTEALHQYLDHIRRSANRQVVMIESLMELARLLRQPMTLQDVNLSEYCLQVWQTFPATVRERVALDVDATPMAKGDPVLLQKLLQVLLDNAVKFTSNVQSPHIRFTACEMNGNPGYSLIDNGVGFQPESATRLFQPFRRLHSNKDYPGVGMGLATAALIVRRHSGDIAAEGRLNGGTTVRFYLPST